MVVSSDWQLAGRAALQNDDVEVVDGIHSDADDVCGSGVVGLATEVLVASSEEVGDSVSDAEDVCGSAVVELISALVGVSIEVSSVEDVSAPVEVEVATDESDADVASEVSSSELVDTPLSVAEVSGTSEDVTGPDELLPSDKLLMAESLEVSGRASDVAEDVPKSDEVVSKGSSVDAEAVVAIEPGLLVPRSVKVSEVLEISLELVVVGPD